MRKSFMLIIIFVIVVLLGGCCCCYVCPPVQNLWSPLITLIKSFCDFLAEDLRAVTPNAAPRILLKTTYEFSSLEDTQKAVYSAWGKENFIKEFLAQLGCSKLSLALSTHLDGTEEYMIATCEAEGQPILFHRIDSNGDLVQMGPDLTITKVEVF